MKRIFKKKKYVRRANWTTGQVTNDQSNNETIETQSFSENENQNKWDEDSSLFTECTDTSVTDNTNSHTSSQCRKTARQTSRKVSITLV